MVDAIRCGAIEFRDKDVIPKQTGPSYGTIFIDLTNGNGKKLMGVRQIADRYDDNANSLPDILIVAAELQKPTDPDFPPFPSGQEEKFLTDKEANCALDAWLKQANIQSKKKLRTLQARENRDNDPRWVKRTYLLQPFNVHQKPDA